MALYRNDDWVYPNNTIPKVDTIKNINAMQDAIIGSTKANRNKDARAAFDKILPVKATYPLNSGNLEKLLGDLYDKDQTTYHEWLYFFTVIGGIAGAIKGVTLDLETLIPPKEILERRDKVIEKLKSKKIDEVEFEQELDKIGADYIEILSKNGSATADIVKSGSKGKASDIRKMILGVGLSIDYKGEVNDVIERAGLDGLDPTQFFNYTSPAVLTQYNKAIGTAKPGYLIKLLLLTAGNIKLSNSDDCGTKKGMSLTITSDKLIKDMAGKQLMSGTLKIGETVKFRSALYCDATDGICRVCYNKKYADRFALKFMANIGSKAVSSFAGPLSGLALKGSHIGVSLDKDKVNFKDEVKSKILHKTFNITEDEIIAKTKTVVVVNKKDYNDDGLIDNGDTYSIASIDAEVDGVSHEIQLGYNINLHKNNAVVSSDTITIVYKPGETIATGEYKSTSTSIDYLKSLFNNGVRHIKTGRSLLQNIHAELSKNGPASIHHLEILILNSFVEYNEKRKVWLPVRLGSQQYTREHMVTVPISVQRLQGAEMEIAGHVTSGFAANISTNKDVDQLSDFSKIVSGDFDQLKGGA